MYVQYPHILNVTLNSAASQNANGDWQPGGSTTGKAYACRGEVNGNNALIAVPDGKQVIYSWVVYMPQGDEIKPGTQAMLSNPETGQVLFNGQVKQYSRGQLNQRVWL